MDREQAIAFIRERLEEGSNRQYGSEAVTELDHALQCAALAQKDAADDELVVAALLHDFGRLVVEDYELPDSVEGNVEPDATVQVMGHDELGARSLGSLFSERVLFCVGKHAQAKRYLCTTEPTYLDGLSESSLTTLEKQGGLMSTQELAAFDRSPYVADAVRVRRWDDLGKVPGMQTRSLDDYLALARQQLQQA